jgi:hypothetical protein
MKLAGCGHDPVAQGIQKECPCKRMPMFFSLPTAAMFGDLESCRTYLSRRGNKFVNLSDAYGYTPISLAAQNNHHEIVELLLQHGALVEGAADSKCSPLLRASHSGALQACQLLLAAGADVERRDLSFGDSRTPLLKSCAAGNAEVVTLLLDNGASLDARDSKGASPLDLAEEHPNICSLLRSRGAEPLSAGEPSLNVSGDASCSAGPVQRDPTPVIQSPPLPTPPSQGKGVTTSLGMACPVCASPVLTAVRTRCCSKLVCKACSRLARGRRGLCAACPKEEE